MTSKTLEVERVDLEEPAVTVYRLRGELTGGPESYAFLEELRTRARATPAPVVINLAGAEHVNSSGVGILAACYTSVTNAGGRICIASASRRLQTILDVVKLSDCFCLFPTEEEAVRQVS